MQHLSRFFGSRIMKTGFSVLITAWVCNLFNLPAIFAIVTAIVTIEPTASDSIKKGFVRFPASAIGSAFSMTFAASLGDTPIVYALSTVCTIAACYKLKLNDGILVATLTAVMMITYTPDHHFLAFVTRLATTSIGILVSTIVNIFILPPNYSSVITKNINNIYNRTSDLLVQMVEDFINEKSPKRLLRSLQEIERILDKTFMLCQYKRDEWKYHRHTTDQMRKFHFELKKLTLLQQIIYHLRNLSFMNVELTEWSEKDKAIIKKAAKSVSNILKDEQHNIPDSHHKIITEMDKRFWQLKEDVPSETKSHYPHHFSTETIIFFELLSIHNILDELDHVGKYEIRHKNRSAKVIINPD